MTSKQLGFYKAAQQAGLNQQDALELTKAASGLMEWLSNTGALGKEMFNTGLTTLNSKASPLTSYLGAALPFLSNGPGTQVKDFGDYFSNFGNRANAIQQTAQSDALNANTNLARSFLNQGYNDTGRSLLQSVQDEAGKANFTRPALNTQLAGNIANVKSQWNDAQGKAFDAEQLRQQTLARSQANLQNSAQQPLAQVGQRIVPQKPQQTAPQAVNASYKEPTTIKPAIAKPPQVKSTPQSYSNEQRLRKPYFMGSSNITQR